MLARGNTEAMNYQARAAHTPLRGAFLLLGFPERLTDFWPPRCMPARASTSAVCRTPHGKFDRWGGGSNVLVCHGPSWSAFTTFRSMVKRRTACTAVSIRSLSRLVVHLCAMFSPGDRSTGGQGNARPRRPATAAGAARGSRALVSAAAATEERSLEAWVSAAGCPERSAWIVPPSLGFRTWC